MNPRLLFLFLFISILSALQAQTVQEEKPAKKSYVLIGIDAGYAIPLDGYSSTDTSGVGSGYASGGFLFQFGVDWIGAHYLGLGISYAFQYSWLNSSVKNATPEEQSYTVGTSPWKNNYVLAGPVFAQNFGKILVTAGVRVGVVLSMSENFRITVPGVDSVSEPVTTGGAGFGFAYQVKGGVGYQFTPKITLALNLNYLGGSPSRSKSYYYYYYSL